MIKQSPEILTIADFDFKWEKFDFLCIATPAMVNKVNINWRSFIFIQLID